MPARFKRRVPLADVLETAQKQFPEHLPSLVEELSGLESSPRYSVIDLLSSLTDEELEQPVQQIDGHIHAFVWDDFGHKFSASDIPILYVLKRNIEGRLPWAHLANLEEIFNGPDMLFGSLHRVANERIFENPTPEECPLISIIGSSNHLPGEKAEAFLDRILLKYPVDYLQDPANKKRLMMNRVRPSIQTQISLAELFAMHAEVEQVTFPEIIADTLLNLELKLAQQMSIFISDRRRGDIIDLLKAYAYMQGEDAVSEEHLDILPYCLWNDPKQMGGINSIVLQIGSPVTAKAIEVLDAAKQLYNQVGDVPSEDYEDEANTWQVKASGSTKQMKTMINDLNHLLASTPNASPSAIRKVNDTVAKIEAMKNEVFEKVKAFLQQE
ncbi:moxR, MoxR-like ATPase [Nostoc flagelliforme CCNUN1]|uniref:MoxR, MoxR-like ATPase n=1 Tax=Nostoc flagelliforme CCNUN1 TaxID=2038116 RepID=A0A2K8SKS6_9NOSO|nr:hypothetical protein [Nostoc flagelliforme]AUB36041.1 moxR, MoxR-like ATPase [Nostoc flagelliforme CCNUN1]